MRYLIDERNLDEKTSLELYRVILTWAAQRGDHFILNLQRGIYDDPQDLTRLCALGQVVSGSVSEKPKRFVSRILGSLCAESAENIYVMGVPDEQFVQELTRKSAPARAIAGDLSPSEDIMVLTGERLLYTLYDYGRTQILELEDEDLKDLRQALEQTNLDLNAIIPAPPYITNS